MVYQYSKIVCISGSMRFAEDMKKSVENLREQGYVVLYPSLSYKDYFPDEWLNKLSTELSSNIEKRLDNMFYDLHLQKIDMCDELLVYNKNGYIGEKVSMEIIYAKSKGKPISYLEPVEMKIESPKMLNMNYVILGSTQFCNEVYEEALRLTERGHNVHPFLIEDNCMDFNPPGLKSTHDNLILKQVDQADVVYVINPNDHLNSDELSIIEYANSKNKTIHYYEVSSEETESLNPGDKLTMLRGTYAGKQAIYCAPYPYPHGGSGHIVMLTDITDKDKMPMRLNVYRDDFEKEENVNE